MATVFVIDLDDMDSSSHTAADPDEDFFDLEEINLDDSISMYSLSRAHTEPVVIDLDVDNEMRDDESPPQSDVPRRARRKSSSPAVAVEPWPQYDSEDDERFIQEISKKKNTKAKKPKRKKKSPPPKKPKRAKKKTKAEQLADIDIRCYEGMFEGVSGRKRKEGLLKTMPESCIGEHEGSGVVLYSNDAERYLPMVFHIVTAKQFYSRYVPVNGEINVGDPPAALSQDYEHWLNEWQDERIDAKHTLIIEGKLAKDIDEARYRLTKMILHFKGIVVIECKSGRDTGERLANIVKIHVEKRQAGLDTAQLQFVQLNRGKSSVDHRENWTTQLECFQGCSRAKAAAIVRKYPDIRALTNVYYDPAISRVQKEKLLEDLISGKRRLGLKLSSSIFKFYETCDSSLML